MDCCEKYDGICQYCGEPLDKENYKIRDSWMGDYPIHEYCEHIKVQVDIFGNIKKWRKFKMWKTVENSNDQRPLEVDQASSKAVVYVRKDFEEVPTIDQDGEQIGTHWRYMENAIPKENWDVYELQMRNAADIEYLSMMTDVDMED